MASTTFGVAPPSSPKALVVGCCDAQQSNTMTSGNKDSPMDATLASINPLLLASACIGSSGALSILFSREDSNVPPMVMPTQALLDLLDTSNKLVTVQQASDDIEDGVDQPALPTTARLLKGVTIEGETALHVVASHGGSTEFLECASIINERDQDLLLSVNKKGDTPLHCAARAGKSKMVSCLIELARNRNKLHELVRKENGLKETALHDAVRIGEKDIVERLLEADQDLANYPREGTSPMYLAILQEKDIIARTLHDKSSGNLSYSGPNGRNALHAAILRGTVMTEDVLKWKNSLTTHVDKDGSTPLHFASSLHPRLRQPQKDYHVNVSCLWHSNYHFNVSCLWHSNIFKQVFKANPAPVYQADNQGLFPIHIAASLGVKGTVGIILEKYPSSAGLRTAKGRTFLHVAVEKRRLNIVSFVCRTPSLAWILNMRDNDGNTALHLAVEVSSFQIFCWLYGNKEVHLSLTNNREETPIDLSRNYIRRGMYYTWTSEYRIYSALSLFGEYRGGLRWDQYEEQYSRQLKPKDKENEEGMLKDSSQLFVIGSVLIATVAFGATFAIPGGFIADDHTNRGTPTLAGRYTFDAFMMANALAFICSGIATIGLIFSGSPLIELRSRQMNLGISAFFMSSSLTSLSAAFALGVYMVLAPVAHATGIVICLLGPLVVLYRSLEFSLKLRILAPPLCRRMGRICGLRWLAETIMLKLLMEFWPFVLIFGWAAIARKL